MAVQMLDPILCIKPPNECCTFWDPDSRWTLRCARATCARRGLQGPPPFRRRRPSRTGRGPRPHPSPAPRHDAPRSNCTCSGPGDKICWSRSALRPESAL
eukprot:1458380-Prymnesium_polylepis.3